MMFNRSSGILLHPTSLPGPYGIGDLGPEAIKWIDFLADSGTGLWQVLPLTPTGYGDSPYQCFSTFAGNPYLISPDNLLEKGLIDRNDLVDKPDFPLDKVDFGRVIYWKLDLLSRSFDHFRFQRNPLVQNDLESFLVRNTEWLDDYALFMAIKEFYGGKPWFMWPANLRKREPQALEDFRQKHDYAINKQIYYQYLFFQQWENIRTYANDKGVKIIGDVPIFIAHDSADAWSNQDYFYFDEYGMPTVVAGVPPDYYAKTGQLWGNPLYRWQKHAEDGYQWWMRRLRAAFEMVDIVRLDHFRGFAGYWEIPSSAKTAETGRWVPGPGAAFLQQVKNEFGTLPFIAEDLGEITPDVGQLLEQFQLPGMKILVFAFNSGEINLFLPHHYQENCIVYTGTHDNDTAVGWYNRIGKGERSFALRYMKSSGDDIAWDLIKLAWSSKAVYAIAQMQDLLSLDNQARMNFPGNLEGNWSWRLSGSYRNDKLLGRLKEINNLSGRSHF